MNFVDFHTHTCHPGVAELVSAPARPQGAHRWSLELHPWYCRRLPDELGSLLESADALGETGFDRTRGALAYPEAQCALFSSALALAADQEKPVVIHAVGSFDLLFETVRPFKKKTHLLFHGFSKRNPELLAQIVAQGFWVSLSPRIVEDAEIRKYCAAHPRHLGLESDDSGIPVEELYDRFALPHFAEQSEENWKEFWKQ